MNLRFNNNTKYNEIELSLENRNYRLTPGNHIDVFVSESKVIFDVQILPANLTEDFGDIEETSFKGKVLNKLSEKFLKKLPETGAHTTVTYELTCGKTDATVELFEGAYSACDGTVADLFDIMPVLYVFAQAETFDGELKVRKAICYNRKKYLKLAKKVLLFLSWRLILPDLFMFSVDYLVLRFCVTDIYITNMINSLYSVSTSERGRMIKEKIDGKDEHSQKSRFGRVVRVVVVLLLIFGVIYWGITSEPDVIVSEDFSTVYCFDEVFEKVDATLPEDAKEVPYENYTAFYDMADDGYDMDNYYCYIYETADGERYMWLKDNCSDESNDDKTYHDYEKPMLYKSSGGITPETNE